MPPKSAGSPVDTSVPAGSDNRTAPPVRTGVAEPFRRFENTLTGRAVGRRIPMKTMRDLTESAPTDTDEDRSEIGLQWLADHGDLLFSYALSRVRDVQAAEDLVQETLLSAIRGIDSFRSQSAPSTWLVGILRNKLVDYYRTRSRDRSLDAGHHAGESVQPFTKSGNWIRAVQSWDDPSALLTEDEFQQVMRGCIDELPELCRQAFEFRVIDELECGEACRLLGISATNLAARLYRARISVRECLSRRWFTAE